MTAIVARQAPTYGTTAELNASALTLYPGERWLAIDAPDAAHMYKTGALAGNKTFSQLPWDPDPASGTGGGAALPQATGPVVFGRNDLTNGDLEILTPTDMEAMLGYALVSSTDPTDTTLSSVSQDLSNHVSITPSSDVFPVAHGINVGAIENPNYLNGRTALYSVVTALAGGNAPTGRIEKVAIGTGTSRGLWYRDDTNGWQRVYPLDTFTPGLRSYFDAPDSAAHAWTLPNGGTQELFAAQRNRVGVTVLEDDAVTHRWNQIRVGSNRITSAAPTGAIVQAYYYNGSATVAIPGATYAIDANGATKPGPWATIPQGVYDREATSGIGYTELCLVGSGGNGTTALNYVGLYVDVR